MGNMELNSKAVTLRVYSFSWKGLPFETSISPMRGLKKCETYCEEKPTLKMWIYKVEYETPITGR